MGNVNPIRRWLVGATSWALRRSAVESSISGSIQEGVDMSTLESLALRLVETTQRVSTRRSFLGRGAAAIVAVAGVSAVSAQSALAYDAVYGIASPSGSIRSQPRLNAGIVDQLYCGEVQERLAGVYGDYVYGTCTSNDPNWWWQIRWPLGGGNYGYGFVHGSVGSDYSRSCC